VAGQGHAAQHASAVPQGDALTRADSEHA
jgi:hypothetical protein